jgi:hypothetical protein
MHRAMEMLLGGFGAVAFGLFLLQTVVTNDVQGTGWWILLAIFGGGWIVVATILLRKHHGWIAAGWVVASILIAAAVVVFGPAMRQGV